MRLSIFNIFFIFLLSFIVVVPEVEAHCPLCTTAAGAGVGIARAYGVDDSIVGLLLGALVSSTALWFNKWLKKKIVFPYQKVIVIALTFASVVIPFYFAGIITNMAAVLSAPSSSMLGLGYLGIDRLLFGILLGTVSVAFAFELSDYIRKKRRHVLWNYQGLSFMAITLMVLTAVLWVIV